MEFNQILYKLVLIDYQLKPLHKHIEIYEKECQLLNNYIKGLFN